MFILRSDVIKLRLKVASNLAPLTKGATSAASGGFVARRFKPQIPRSPFVKGAND